jgi:hypothetical protein
MFYLIEFGLISYYGSNRSYITTDDGIKLLFEIEHKKVTEKITTSDILLCLE